MKSHCSLHEAFRTLHDPRSKEGQRHSLVAMLSHLVVAMMAGCNSLEAVSAFVRDRDESLARLLGYVPSKRSGTLHLPCKATFSNLLARLDLHAVGGVVRTWLARRFPDDAPPIALDGKAQLGASDDRQSPLRVLNAYCPAIAQVADQFALAEGEGELTAALRWIAQLPDGPGLVTADAGFCHREFCEQLVAKGRDYAVAVKDNQPTLHAAIHRAFDTRRDHDRALSAPAMCG